MCINTEQAEKIMQLAREFEEMGRLSQFYAYTDYQRLVAEHRIKAECDLIEYINILSGENRD